jgi:hypothetical protein
LKNSKLMFLKSKLMFLESRSFNQYTLKNSTISNKQLMS